MLRCEAPGCIRITAYHAPLISRLLSVFTAVPYFFPSKPVSYVAILAYQKVFVKTESFLKTQNEAQSNKSRLRLTSKGIICSHSFLFAEFLELIRHKLYLHSYDHLYVSL